MLNNVFNNITTSRRQGQVRKGLSEGSRSAKLRIHGQKRYIRPGFRDESAQDDEIQGVANQGKWRNCAVKVYTLIWGGLVHRRGETLSKERQMGNWQSNPGCINSPSFDVSETDGIRKCSLSGIMGNCGIDESEVSIGHISQSAKVMLGAGRRTEHFSRGSLLLLNFSEVWRTHP